MDYRVSVIWSVVVKDIKKQEVRRMKWEDQNCHFCPEAKVQESVSERTVSVALIMTLDIIALIICAFECVNCVIRIVTFYATRHDVNVETFCHLYMC